MKTKLIIALAGAACLSLSGCSDLLDIKQHGVLNYETYYKTPDQILSADAAMYLEVRGWEYNVLLCKSMLTDDFVAGGSMRGDNTDLEHLNEFTFDAEQDYIQNMFQTYYSLIYKANVILGHVEDNDVQYAGMARAEAKVFRAFAYFDLVSMWGNPPLVDHELAPSEYSRPNGTDEQLWSLMEQDLTEAIESGYLTEKTSVDDAETWRVTKQFAQALLGKVYLWQNKYADAAKQFNAVVASGKYDLFRGPYEDMMRAANKHNCESLFESNKVADDNNPFQNFSLYKLMTGWRMDKMNWPADTPLMNTGWGFRVPTKDLYDDFVADEGVDGYRLNNTMKTLDQIGDQLSITLKSPIVGEGYFFWKDRALAEDRGYANDFVYAGNVLWMRYAEVLLCGAEASLLAGDSATALKYINLVRERAHLSPLSSVTLDQIKLEKRLELCGEGQRFQDLLRWGDAEAKMKDNGKQYPVLAVNGEVSYVSCNNPVYGFKKEKHSRLPYPATEIRLNSEIQQNNGY
ncbi:MAG: RagB/SusD family nutrient uptake outer membrane protein [Candidatus Cryptobacteroides sp.]